MSDLPTLKVLFICTHNRCRSVLCEALTNHWANGVLKAYSAGSAPAGEVYPLTLRALEKHGVNTADLKSQSWDDFSDMAPDVIITVCDSAAQEQCPVWFGEALQLHWPLLDPSKLEGPDEHILGAFETLMLEIQEKILTLLELHKQAQSKTDFAALVRECFETTALEPAD